MIRSLPRPLTDIALLASRIALGVVLIAHGLQKLSNGWDATAQGFAGMGIPAADVAAAFAIAVEIGGGALIILGAFTTVAGLLVVVDMAGALIFAHASAGVFVAEGGWELVAMIATTALVLAAVGAGRLSLDARLPGLRRLGAKPVTA
jgi:putative oxidoreductase